MPPTRGAAMGFITSAPHLFPQNGIRLASTTHTSLFWPQAVDTLR